MPQESVLRSAECSLVSDEVRQTAKHVQTSLALVDEITFVYHVISNLKKKKIIKIKFRLIVSLTGIK